ncbi:MAG TPA: ATP-binding protein [Bryobacteraceae bacterium]|nr:ATP-binding protein [Bryobacteraceae bacterium]
MNELKSQFANALVVILTVAAVVAGFYNFQQNFDPEKRFRLPEDGVTWVDRKTPAGESVVEALHVAPGSTGEQAGIDAGDRLLSIGGFQIQQAHLVPLALSKMPLQLRAPYLLERNGIQFEAKVIIADRQPSPTLPYQYAIGLAYLGIGLFVFFRRGSAPKATHFLCLCMASFVFSTFHYTGKLNNFDKVVYWGNILAGILAPTTFLHFCLSFPESRGWMKRRGSTALIYLPGSLLFALVAVIAAGNLRVDISPVELRWLLDRLLLAFLSFNYLLGALVLHREYLRASDTIVRQQLKWLRNGTILAIVPFTSMYVLPFLLGVAPGPYMQWAVIFLPFLPLTWAYAIFRYRLMDVDVIFQQGYVYTLATLAVLGAVYGLFFTIGKFEDIGVSAVLGLILVATFVFQAIRPWIQEQLDRYFFYKDRYGYRQTLVDFARELSSETDLDRMFASMTERLTRTLSIRHLAVFIRDEDRERFSLRLWHGRQEPPPSLLDLSFLSTQPSGPYLFFERTHHNFDVISREWPSSVRQTISDLDLTYYLPCIVRGKTIAYLGLSRTDEGDFLSSDDLDLLVTLSRYVAIAVENGRLYHSLQQKVDEYERLKEFSENIVESINVGILAADLSGRVESWNSQIERLTGIPRHVALGRLLSELLPADLCSKFEEVSGDTGIQNIYKFCYRPVTVFSAVAAGSGNGRNSRPEPATREHILNIAIAPLFSKDLREIGRLIIFDDITDRSELESRLVQADKLSSIGLLAAGVAHEVNTPLAVISTYAQMLAKQVSEDEQKSRLLDKIAKQTFRASEIVNSLLNFSRTSPGEFGEVDINHVIHETVSLVKHQLDKGRIVVKADLEKGMPPVTGNSGKLQQVFLNLVLNARDAMDGGGTLRLRTWSDGAYARIEVADSGHGISQDHIPRIYDPFFTTKAARKGTGLGLSVTYGIVQEHGGSIDVQSEPGAGTLFHLEFPLARKPVNA